MSLVILEKIAESYIKDIPSNWYDVNFEKFGIDYSLFDYQQKALENCLKILYQYYTDKSKLYKYYKLEGLTDNLEEKLKIGNYQFKDLINRVSFWMATGSGKTLLMVKLIEILHSLMKNNLIPKKDIMILAPRDEIIEQIKRHINIFNKGSNLYIHPIDLRKWEENKQFSFFDNQINVYIYRADNITEENKEKQIDYKTYLNNGNWYVILDEAHKGEKTTSKRQKYYVVFAKNGFLFNFSATFKDDIDIITTVSNFNIQKFLENGYGKKIYVSNAEFKNFKIKNDLSSEEKKLQIAKSLILFAFVKKIAIKIKNIKKEFYHYPLLTTLANSVHTDKADLKIFFKLLSDIANNKFDFETAKEELIKDLNKQRKYIFGLDKIDFIDEIQKLEKEEFFKFVFNTTNPSKIEYVKIKGNDRELLFKLKGSNEYFMLIVADKIIKWEDDTLKEFEKSETTEKSIFSDINDRTDINILVGSRIFVEGWDSNRPNVLNFINIGVNEEAKKFVLQAIGRGIRINPIGKERKRFEALNKEIFGIDNEEIRKLSKLTKPLETLFVFATNKKVIKAILEELERQGKVNLYTVKNIKKNPNINNEKLPLLVPEFEETGLNNKSFKISEEDFKRLEEFMNKKSEKVLILKENIKVRTLKKLKSKGNFIFSGNKTSVKETKLLKNIDKYFNKPSKKFKRLVILEDHINHFKRIQTDLEEIQQLEEELKKVLGKFINNETENKKIKEIEEAFRNGIFSEDTYFILKQQLSLFDADDFNKYEFKILKNYIDYEIFKEHYYIPILLKRNLTKIFKNTIDVDSEIKFLKELSEYLKKPDNKVSLFDWWYFSKINEHTDKIKIPYFDTSKGDYSYFIPDFIFWMKKGNRYFIKFVDPKGIEIGIRKTLDKIRGFQQFKREVKEAIIELFIFNKNKLDIQELDKHIIQNVEDIFK